MSAQSPCFGSDAWLNQVFLDPPARKVKGRTKWTHRHAPWVPHLNRLAFVESRNELVGLLALEYLQRQGRILRFKEQAFTTPAELWALATKCLPNVGAQGYTPDLFADGGAGARYVIEVKSARFVTRAMEQDFELWKGKFNEYGMKYLVWTDRNSLTAPLRQNLLRLRRASVDCISRDEVEQLTHILERQGPMPLWALYNTDIDIDLIAHAAWLGKVFFPLCEPVSERTLVSLVPTEDLATILFGIEPDMYAWWNALEAA